MAYVVLFNMQSLPNVSRLIFSGVSAFICVSLMLFPWIIEIFVVTHQPFDYKIITMVICGAIQTLLAFYGGIAMGYTKAFWHLCNGKSFKNLDDPELEEQERMCCPVASKYETLYTPGYILCILPQWVLTNCIISWVLIDTRDGPSLPLYVYIMVYLPLVTYIVCFVCGSAIRTAKNTSDEEYESVK